MSESNSVSPATAELLDSDLINPERASQQAVSGGEILKREREAAGLHIGALAVQLKVPVKKLEALEAGRLDLLPDVVFARALAASVCRTLKIDATKVLELFPLSVEPKLGQQAVRAAPAFHAAGAGLRLGTGRQISRTAVLSGAVLLLAALGLVFLPSLKTSFSRSKPETVNSPAVIFLPNTEPDAAGAGTSSNGVTTFGPALAAPALAASAAPVLLPVAAAASGALAVSAATATATATANSAAALSANFMTLTARVPAWVQVNDAGGNVLLRRNLSAGEVVGLVGPLPLSAVVGRADAVQVKVRGQAFDLSSFTRDNVARFEVK